jgi:hypothetical protein
LYASSARTGLAVDPVSLRTPAPTDVMGMVDVADPFILQRSIKIRRGQPPE